MISRSDTVALNLLQLAGTGIAALRKDTLIIATALATLLVDQITKNAAILALRETPETKLNSIAGIALYENNGAFLGIMQGHSLLLLAITVPITILALSMAYSAYGKRNIGKTGRVGMALLLAGVAGNAVDRLLYGAVIDFIYVGNVIYNIADVAIFAGQIMVASLAIRQIKAGCRKSRNETVKPQTDPETAAAP